MGDEKSCPSKAISYNRSKNRSLATLCYGKKQYSIAESARLARANTGAENAQTRADRLEEICGEQMAAWEEHLSTIRAERAVREAAWLARRLLLENRDLEVLELATEKMADARGRAGQEL